MNSRSSSVNFGKVVSQRIAGEMTTQFNSAGYYGLRVRRIGTEATLLMLSKLIK